MVFQLENLLACDFQDSGVGWVGDLGVLPEWRGRGIARALLAASFEAFRARRLATARLNVDAENETGSKRSRRRCASSA